MIFRDTCFGYWFLNHKKYNKLLHGMNSIKIVTLPSIQNFETSQTETKHTHTHTHTQMGMDFGESLCRMISTKQIRTLS
jgi:hypothetical protein